MTALVETINRPRLSVESLGKNLIGKKSGIDTLPLRRALRGVGVKASTGVENVLFVAVGRPKAKIKRILEKKDRGEELSTKEQRELEQWEREQGRRQDKMAANSGKGSLATGPRKWG